MLKRAFNSLFEADPIKSGKDDPIVSNLPNSFKKSGKVDYKGEQLSYSQLKEFDKNCEKNKESKKRDDTFDNV